MNDTNVPTNGDRPMAKKKPVKEASKVPDRKRKSDVEFVIKEPFSLIKYDGEFRAKLEDSILLAAAKLIRKAVKSKNFELNPAQAFALAVEWRKLVHESGWYVDRSDS